MLSFAEQVNRKDNYEKDRTKTGFNCLTEEENKLQENGQRNEMKVEPFVMTIFQMISKSYQMKWCSSEQN